jgi:hypothetical protein
MKNNLITCCVVSALLLGGSLVMAGQQELALPMVSSAEVPLYPPLARAANISGVLHVVITTDGHRVVTAHAQEGHKFLRDAAEKNAMSWQFTTHEPTTLTVTYVYKLVDDLNPHLNNPRVILQLPTEVEVDAQRWPGTRDMPISHTDGAAVSPSGDATLVHESGHVIDTPKPQ